MIYLPRIHCALLVISKCWLLVYVYRSAGAVRGSGIKGVPLVIIIWACLFSLRSLWCRTDCALHPSVLAARLLLPDPCNPRVLAQSPPRSSASNKQPLINHALLITQALLSARVCEIDLVCALLHRETPCFCPSHLPRHRCQWRVSPPDLLLFTFLFVFPPFHPSRTLSSFFPLSHPITAGPDASFGLKSHIFSIIKFEILCQKLSKITIILFAPASLWSVWP